VGKVFYSLTLVAALCALWFTLSGHTEPLLLILGAISITVVLIIVERMEILDGEASPFHRLLFAVSYWVWLGGEIAKANIEVAKAILKADLELTPRLFRIKASQRTDLGRTIFANSITLTPGTVTVNVDEDDLIIHALLDSMSDPAGFEEMNRRSRIAAEGRGA
jgi:multicomponent Na+:H+ antiporter subunit E